MVVEVPIPKGAAYTPGMVPFSVEATPDTSVQVMPSSVKPFEPADSEAKYCGSSGPGVNVTTGAALAAAVRANQANPVVINKVLRI